MNNIYKSFKDNFRSSSPKTYYQADKYKIFIKFIISGGIAGFIDLSLLYILTDILNIWYLLSAGLAFIIAFFVSFTLQKFWTFRDNNRKKFYQQISLYFIVGVMNLFLNTGGMYLLVDRFKIWYLLAQVIIGGFLGINSFLIYKFIIFKKKRIESRKRGDGGLKILIATGIFPPDIGGPATYVETLCQKLPKLGCEVRVITYSDDGVSNSKQIYRISRKQNIILRYFKYFWQVWKLSSWADIIYAHDLVSVGLPCALVKSLKLKIKLIVRLGGDFLWEKAYNNGWTDKPLRAYYEQPKNLKEKVFLVIYNFVLSRCDKIIFSTAWQKEIYEKYLNINSGKVVVIGNAFPEFNFVQGQDKILSSQNKNILFAGRLIKLKNLGVVLRVVEQLGGVNLVIIGEGPEEGNLKKLAKQLKISNRVGFKEKMNNKKLSKEILNSFIVIIPSITDISPNLVFECIKLGKPIIVTRESGFYNKYKDSLIFIDPFSEDDIREKIMYLLKEENYSNYLNTVRSIDTSRSKDDLASDHYNFFKNLLR